VNKAETTIEYRWSGIDKHHQRCQGLISAKTPTQARVELKRMGISVISIKAKPRNWLAKHQPIKTKDITLFARQLATMLEAGVPLVQSLEIISRSQTKPSMAKLLLAIKTDIENGDSLAYALAKHSMHFDKLFCDLVAAGEQAGVLETLLDKIASYKEKIETIKNKVKKALSYPLAVIIVALIVTMILLMFVVPVFEDLFKSFGAELPLFTKSVLALSMMIQSQWWLIVAIMGTLSYSIGYFKQRSQPFKHRLDQLLLKLPVFGAIIEKSIIARFARTLGTVCTAGVPLVDGLMSVAGACGNLVYYNAVLKMREDVATGLPLQFSMQQSGLFPHLLMQMVAIGEASGTLDSMLIKVASYYESELDNLLDQLNSLMEPMIMVILGGLVGSLIVAMYLPIFQLGTVIA
jgi:type IV pilus assembly protein PilC